MDAEYCAYDSQHAAEYSNIEYVYIHKLWAQVN